MLGAGPWSFGWNQGRVEFGKGLPLPVIPVHIDFNNREVVSVRKNAALFYRHVLLPQQILVQINVFAC